ncbi:hypothetical protein KMS84_07465 [Streptomyces sp. IBSBF 2807]|nr:hypothetical protein [Streptomyces hilarionis]MCQ9130644.1 hypothetical protein [Streptomyces hilarionis]
MRERKQDRAAEDGAERERRRVRFGALPERVLPRDMVEERPAIPRDPARDAYDPDEFAVRYGL